MKLFKHRHFKYDIIIWAVRWYCKYCISYRDLEEMLTEKGVEVDHSTIYRWVQYYAPKILEKLKWYWKPKLGLSWRVDETYIKVKGKWAYLYQALDKDGNTIYFCLPSTRSINAAKRFLSKALRSIPEHARPNTINTDKNQTYTRAIAKLQAEGLCSLALKHRQIKYLNNIIESDHGKLKRLIKPTLGSNQWNQLMPPSKVLKLCECLRKEDSTSGNMGKVFLGKLESLLIIYLLSKPLGE